MPIDRSPPPPQQPVIPGTSASDELINQHVNLEKSFQHTNMGLSNSGESREINANEFRLLKLPTFWHKQPKLWFAQLESEFLAFRIRSDDIKYSTVIRHLDEQALVMVAELIERPPERDKYESLKKLLIQRFTDSDEKRLRQLLAGIELSDKKPSDLLRELKQLAGGTISDNVLHSIWLQRLPYRVQATLAVVEGSPLVKLAELADKIMDRESGLQIATITPSVDSSNSKSCDLADLERRISVLEVRHSRERSKSRSYGRKKFRSNSRNKKFEKKEEKICFYHKKFGDKAVKCTIPCDMAKSFTDKEKN